jgi:hypothetical protein
MSRKTDIKGLLEYLVRSLVEEPDQVAVLELEKEGVVIMELKVSASDRGRVIGKQGKTIKAIRKLLSAASSGSDRRIAVELVE